MTTIVELEGATKIYHTGGVPVTALSDVSLTIEMGDFAVLAGPSGSGKSTLLHLIGALDRPSEGSVHVGGKNLACLSRKEKSDFRLRKIGFVFQAYNLIPVLSAWENVEYPLLLQGISEKECDRRVGGLLRRVGLGDHLYKKPGEMSGGQQQRVAVARALASHPEIILADEPTANLDSHTGSTLIDLFHELNSEFKTTFIFASHDPMVIERAERVIRLLDGRVVL